MQRAREGKENFRDHLASRGQGEFALGVPQKADEERKPRAFRIFFARHTAGLAQKKELKLEMILLVEGTTGKSTNGEVHDEK